MTAINPFSGGSCQDLWSQAPHAAFVSHLIRGDHCLHSKTKCDTVCHTCEETALHKVMISDFLGSGIGFTQLGPQ